MQKKIRRLTGHDIICGYGRIGRISAREFVLKLLLFIFVEQNPELCRCIESEDILISLEEPTAIGHLEAIAAGRG